MRQARRKSARSTDQRTCALGAWGSGGACGCCGRRRCASSCRSRACRTARCSSRTRPRRGCRRARSDQAQQACFRATSLQALAWPPALLQLPPNPRRQPLWLRLRGLTRRVGCACASSSCRARAPLRCRTNTAQSACVNTVRATEHYSQSSPCTRCSAQRRGCHRTDRTWAHQLTLTALELQE